MVLLLMSLFSESSSALTKSTSPQGPSVKALMIGFSEAVSPHGPGPALYFFTGIFPRALSASSLVP